MPPRASAAKAGRATAAAYYPLRLVTRVGTMELRVPQDWQARFSTQLFERYQRSEKALVAALVEMYVQVVSTRKIKAITEELCGHEFSASAISEMNVKLDGELERFARRTKRPLLITDITRTRLDFSWHPKLVSNTCLLFTNLVSGRSLQALDR